MIQHPRLLLPTPSSAVKAAIRINVKSNKHNIDFFFKTNVVLSVVWATLIAYQRKLDSYQISSRQRCDCRYLSGFPACRPVTGDWVPAPTAQWSVCGPMAWGECPFMLTHKTINLTCSVQTGGGCTPVKYECCHQLYYTDRDSQYRLGSWKENLPIFHSY